MTEEENTSVIEEVAPPSEPEQEQDVQQEETQVPLSRPITDQEYNWAEARRRNSELERRLEQQEAELRRLQSHNAPKEPEDELATLADDDIITVKQHKQMAAKIAKQVAEDVYRQKEALTIDDRLKSKFPDFDDVVTKENIDLLRQQDPELSMAIQRLSDDPFSQAALAYKLLKRSGAGVDMAKTQNQKARAIENSKKPGSVQSVTKSSAISNVHNYDGMLTDEMKAQYRKETAEAIRNA